MDKQLIPAVGHVGINVTDLERSRRFYEAALGFETVGQSEADGRRFAFLGAGGDVLLTLWEQSEGSFDAGRPGLHHLAFRVATIEQVEQAQARLRDLGARFLYDGVVAHREGAASGGVFFADPDGVRIEIFAPQGAQERHAPHTDGPACGFF
jgi:lactoylglutathione lyase